MAPEYCLLDIQWWPVCMSKAEWAAWLQSVCAVLAILAGFIYITLQRKHARAAALESTRLARRQVLQAVLVTLSDAHAVALVARAELDDDLKDWRLIAEEADRVHAALDVLPAIGIGDAAVIHRINVTKADLRGLARATRLLMSLEMSAERYANSVAFFDQRTRLYARNVDAIAKLIEECSTEEEKRLADGEESLQIEDFEWLSELRSSKPVKEEVSPLQKSSGRNATSHD